MEAGRAWGELCAASLLLHCLFWPGKSEAAQRIERRLNNPNTRRMPLLQSPTDTGMSMVTCPAVWGAGATSGGSPPASAATTRPTPGRWAGWAWHGCVLPGAWTGQNIHLEEE